MKTLKKLLLIVLCFGFLIQYYSYSLDNLPCPGCDNGPWTQQTNTISLDFCGQGCLVQVIWWTRVVTCPGTTFTTYELQLTEIDWIPPGNPGCASCFCANDTGYKYILGWMLDHYPGHQPGDGESYDFSAVSANCWQTTSTGLTYCPYSGCCYQTYKVTRNGSTYTNELLSAIPGPPCDPLHPECKPKCQEAASSQMPFPKKSIEDEQPSPINSTDNSIVKPNPSQEFVTIGFKSDAKGAVDILITNNMGQLVYSSHILKNSNKLDVNIDVTKMTNGTYYYQFITNDNIYRGQFIVNH